MHRMSFSEQRLIFTMLKPDISRFESSVDPDQLASEKPADQDLQYFPLCLEMRANNRNPMSFIFRIK